MTSSASPWASASSGPATPHVLGLGGVVFSLAQSSLAGWRSPVVLTALSGGLLVLLASQLHRGRVDPDVLLPPSILRARPVLAGLLGGFAYNFTLYGMLLVYTFDLQNLRHYSAIRTGLALLPLTVVATTGTILLGGRFVARRGPRQGLAVRGMITSARIEALRELGGTGWLTALRAPAIAKLAAANGPLQLSLFDQQDLAEISHPDYPGERLVACRNPLLAVERARKRDALLAATEAVLAPITAAVTAGRLAGADQIGLRVGKIINKTRWPNTST